MISREQETFDHLTKNKYSDTENILYEIAISLGRIADMLAEQNLYIIDYRSEEKQDESCN